MSGARHAIESDPRYRAWVLAAAASVAVVGIGVFGAVGTLGGGGGHENVAAAANRFRPLAGWWQIETEDRSGAGCLAAGCPMSFRRWEAETPPNPADLRRAMETAGWSDPDIDGTCRPTETRSGSFPLCTGRASDDHMELTVTVTHGGAYNVTLTVESR